ncbi:MAG: 16S rRNA (guanine(966)-N(2))-methyltransferase RsmD [Coraliomargarita sp.]
MRITGGNARGIPLKAPKGESTRPATDRMREAVFSSLGPSVEGCTVVDLFAGTGSYGLEALSRGAASATFVENDRAALNCLKQNVQAVLRSCSLDTSLASVSSQDVYTLKPSGAGFDLVFLDPPYASITTGLARMFENAVNHLATEDARVLVELPGNLDPVVAGWELTRRIGKAGKDKPTAALFERAR